jgi:Leucine-rich repeat (LRR) protein
MGNHQSRAASAPSLALATQGLVTSALTSDEALQQQLADLNQPYDDEGDREEMEAAERHLRSLVSTVSPSSALLLHESTAAFIAEYRREAREVLQRVRRQKSTFPNNDNDHAEDDGRSNDELPALVLPKRQLTCLTAALGSYPQELMRRVACLNLADNRLTALPADFASMFPKLQRLDLSHNRLAHLPDSLGELQELQWLDVTGNHGLCKLPTLLPGGLRSLGMSECAFDALPGALGGLRHLRKLGAFNNRIRDLDPEIMQAWTNLTKLDLSGNVVRSLPTVFGQCLPALQWLNLTRNQLETIPDNAFQGLANLQQLGVAGNRLERLPDLTTCRQLRMVAAFSNALTTLDGANMHRLGRLEHMDVSGNRLTLFPARILMLPRLRHVSAAQNRIHTIALDGYRQVPVRNVDSKELVLNLSDNQLRAIPYVLLVQSNIQQVQLYENPLAKGQGHPHPILNKPASLVDTCLQRILRPIFSLPTQPSPSSPASSSIHDAKNLIRSPMDLYLVKRLLDTHSDDDHANDHGDHMDDADSHGSGPEMTGLVAWRLTCAHCHQLFRHRPWTTWQVEAIQRSRQSGNRLKVHLPPYIAPDSTEGTLQHGPLAVPIQWLHCSQHCAQRHIYPLNQHSHNLHRR